MISLSVALAIIIFDSLYIAKPPTFFSTSYGAVFISITKSTLLLELFPLFELGGVFEEFGLASSLEQDCIHPKMSIAAPLRPTFSMNSFLSILSLFIIDKTNVQTICLN